MQFRLQFDALDAFHLAVLNPLMAQHFPPLEETLRTIATRKRTLLGVLFPYVHLQLVVPAVRFAAIATLEGMYIFVPQLVHTPIAVRTKPFPANPTLLRTFARVHGLMIAQVATALKTHLTLATTVRSLVGVGHLVAQQVRLAQKLFRARAAFVLLFAVYLPVRQHRTAGVEPFLTHVAHVLTVARVCTVGVAV